MSLWPKNVWHFCTLTHRLIWDHGNSTTDGQLYKPTNTLTSWHLFLENRNKHSCTIISSLLFLEPGQRIIWHERQKVLCWWPWYGLLIIIFIIIVIIINHVLVSSSFITNISSNANNIWNFNDDINVEKHTLQQISGEQMSLEKGLDQNAPNSEKSTHQCFV